MRAFLYFCALLLGLSGCLLAVGGCAAARPWPGFNAPPYLPARSGSKPLSRVDSLRRPHLARK